MIASNPGDGIIHRPAHISSVFSTLTTLITTFLSVIPFTTFTALFVLLALGSAGNGFLHLFSIAFPALLGLGGTSATHGAGHQSSSGQKQGNAGAGHGKTQRVSRCEVAAPGGPCFCHSLWCHSSQSMRFALEPLLEAQQVADLRMELLAEADAWRPGVETAGWHARTVKNNRQLDRSSALQGQLTPSVVEPLLRHPLVQSAALPVRVHGLLFSRSGPGEGYGRHVDNAFMAGGRSDLSFTLFLSDPSEYEGGALVLESPSVEEALRLPAGHALVYPSTLLHRVEPVTQGSVWWPWAGFRAGFATPSGVNCCSN